jgi:hypothetical protein
MWGGKQQALNRMDESARVWRLAGILVVGAGGTPAVRTEDCSDLGNRLLGIPLTVGGISAHWRYPFLLLPAS